MNNPEALLTTLRSALNELATALKEYYDLKIDTELSVEYIGNILDSEIIG